MGARREERNPRRGESDGEKGRSVPKMREREREGGKEIGNPVDKGQRGGARGLGDSCRPCEGPSTRPGRLPRNTPRALEGTIARERERQREDVIAGTERGRGVRKRERETGIEAGTKKTRGSNGSE